MLAAIAAATRLDAVELDRDLIPRLRARFGDAGLVLHEADALNFDFAELAAQVRNATGGIPIGFKMSAQHIEQDLDFALEVGVDYVQGHFVDRPVNLGSMTTGTYRALNP